MRGDKQKSNIQVLLSELIFSRFHHRLILALFSAPRPRRRRHPRLALDRHGGILARASLDPHVPLLPRFGEVGDELPVPGLEVVQLPTRDGDGLADEQREEVLVAERPDGERVVFAQRVHLERLAEDVEHEHRRERAVDEELREPVRRTRVLRVEVDGVGVAGERAEAEEQRRRGHHALSVRWRRRWAEEATWRAVTAAAARLARLENRGDFLHEAQVFLLLDEAGFVPVPGEQEAIVLQDRGSLVVPLRLDQVPRQRDIELRILGVWIAHESRVGDPLVDRHKRRVVDVDERILEF